MREQLQNEKVAHTRLQTEYAIEKGDAAADRVSDKGMGLGPGLSPGV